MLQWMQVFFRNIGIFVVGIILGVFILYLSDRSPPVVIHGYSLGKVAYIVGEPLTIDWNLERDVSRQCDLTLYAEIIDSDKNRYTYDKQTVPAHLLSLRDDMSPSVSKVVRTIPDNMSQGIAHYNVLLEYVCNPTHRLWPIRIPLSAQFVIQ